ncbi:hypothetical protein KEJ15_09205 [Candidatus Bathyarchaeota archaeon]|nr:hypothetical protein [Candidatus Bathyarchaeota archaeon]
MESALKAYMRGGVERDRVYKERHFTIRLQLPSLKGYELQMRVQDLNEQLDELKQMIAECKEAISQLKHDVDPEQLRLKYRISKTLNTKTEDLIEQFEAEREWRKQAAKWVRRERAIFLWELRLRKAAGVKLPFMRHQLKTLNKEAYLQLCRMKDLSEQLRQACEAYHKVQSKHNLLLMKLEKLSLQRFEGESENWTNMLVPAEIRELKFLEDFSHREEGREKLACH